MSSPAHMMSLWDDMNLHYSYFELKKIDGEMLKGKYRERAVSSGSLPAFVDVLGEMLGEFDDGTSGSASPKARSLLHAPRALKTNINFQVTEATVEGSVWVGNGFARVGLIKPEGFGVVRIDPAKSGESRGRRPGRRLHPSPCQCTRLLGRPARRGRG